MVPSASGAISPNGLNKAIHVHQLPLPAPEDHLVKLNERRAFYNLSFSYAHLQVEMEERYKIYYRSILTEACSRFLFWFKCARYRLWVEWSLVCPMPRSTWTISLLVTFQYTNMAHIWKKSSIVFNPAVATFKWRRAQFFCRAYAFWALWWKRMVEGDIQIKWQCFKISSLLLTERHFGPS